MGFIRAITLLTFFPFICINGYGQAFSGVFNGENTINLVGENPGFAFSNDRAQINAFGIGTLFGGNYIQFKHSIYSYFDSGKVYPGNQYNRNLNTNERLLWMNTEIKGPGASFIIKKRYTFAITTGLRMLINADHLDNKVFMLMGANAPLDSQKNNNYSINNYSFTAQMFKELNITYADYLFQRGETNIVGGATVKLLLGVGAVGMGIPKLTFTSENNSGLADNVAGSAKFVSTPLANRLALTSSPFKAMNSPMNNFGVGADLGVIYTVNFYDQFHKTKDYQFKISASITDIGGISYSASSMSGSYSITNRSINYKNIQNNPLETFGNRLFNEYLVDTVIKATGNVAKFRVGLPTAFRMNIDANIVRNTFFLNGNLVLNLRSPSADKFVNHYVSMVTITPRYMLQKNVGFAMPFTFTFLGQGYLGGTVFFGPFYVGSSSFFNTQLGNSFNNLNLYTGVTLKVPPKKMRAKDFMMM